MEQKAYRVTLTKKAILTVAAASETEALEVADANLDGTEFKLTSVAVRPAPKVRTKSSERLASNVCPECGRAFKSNLMLLTHRVSKHGATISVP